jgi:hypothetical protein
MSDDRLAELVASLERVADAEVRATVQELMTLVVDMHGEALSRLLSIVAECDGDAGAALRLISADPLVRPVLELQGLAPEAPAPDPTIVPVTLLPTRSVERCELCGGPAGEDHPHVVDTEAHGASSLACACRPCHLLLAASSSGRWRAVVDDWRSVSSIELPDVPVGVAFVVVDPMRERPVAYYPGPAGATESELDVPVDALPSLAPGTEALLVRDGEAFVVPVSEAYGLAGELREHWEGLTGGDGPGRVLDAFVERARSRARATERSPR